ncbi:uncharacterized protein (TIGR02117 family) [Pedobacter sp. UYP30]|uniref:TIGR02117 family protein n=1 Tax=Pedobacter sp. UYP30 TaxID=1756400 RepID=UPI00339576C9
MFIKKILKPVLYFTVSLVAFILLYLGSAYILSRIKVDEEKNIKDEVAIYIQTNGVHTDIVVPIKNSQFDWSKEVKFTNTVSKDTLARYLAMGWGDKGFYLDTPTWADLKVSTALNAAFALGTTAIHATFYRTMIEDDECKKIMISAEQYHRLIKYITDSFKRDKEGHFINIKTNANYDNADAFYEANGSYSLFYTCNTWANNALKKCGQKACLWTPFDTGIFLKYQDVKHK